MTARIGWKRAEDWLEEGMFEPRELHTFHISPRGQIGAPNFLVQFAVFGSWDRVLIHMKSVRPHHAETFTQEVTNFFCTVYERPAGFFVDTRSRRDFRIVSQNENRAALVLFTY